MKTKHFESGKYIWECKSSPSGGSIDIVYLKSQISEVKKRFSQEGLPSGYYYVFPINYISNAARYELDNFKKEYSGQVKIDYYDCEQIDKLFKNLSKLQIMQDLIDYIEQVRKS